MNINFIEGWNAIGDLMIEMEDYVQAMSFYNRAVKIDDNNVQALTGLGKCYLQ